MNFLFLVPRYHINLHYMVMALKNKGHLVSMLTMYRGESEDYSVLEPEVIGYSSFFCFLNRFLNKSGGGLIKSDFEIKYSYPPILKLFRKIKNADSDVIVVKNIHSTYSLLSLIFGRFLGKKIIILLQIEKFRKRSKSLSVFLASKIFGAEIITPILGDKRYKNYNDSLHYIPFPIKIDKFEKTNFKDDRINIICVGKFQERKGQLILAEAVNRLKDEFKLNVVFIGQRDEEGYIEKLLKYIKNSNLENIVKIIFNIKHENVLKMYQDCDLFILPSWSEAASFAVLEAMASGLPVISSDDNGTKCYIKEGKNGYIFKHRNVDDLINKIKMIIYLKENIVKMGKESLSIVRMDHSLDYFYDNFIKLI